MTVFPEDKIRHICVEVHNGRGGHGTFLRTLVNAYLLADYTNALILAEPMSHIILKYNLDEYLDNFEQHR